VENGRKPRSGDGQTTAPEPQLSVTRVTCERCGSPFAPRRADARFCSPKCRVASHRKGAPSSTQTKGIDPTLVDPRLVLAEIAGNPAQPASARVAAAKALLATQQKAPAQDRDDFTNIRAVEMLAAKAKPNRIPIVEVYRGVGVQDQQPADRIERIVKPEIDAVYDMRDLEALYELTGDVARCPEARLFSAAKLEALWQQATEERRRRPDIDLETVRARVAGLDSARWRSPWVYGTLPTSPSAPGCSRPGAAERDFPLDHAEA
jgi:hypothetical protein